MRHLILTFRISEPVTCSSLTFYHWATYPFLFFTCSVLPGPRVLHPGLQRGHHHRDPGHQARDAEVCTHTSGGLFPVKTLLTCVVCDEFISICVAAKNNFDLCGLGHIGSFQCGHKKKLLSCLVLDGFVSLCCHKRYFWVVVWDGFSLFRIWNVIAEAALLIHELYLLDLCCFPILEHLPNRCL